MSRYRVYRPTRRGMQASGYAVGVVVPRDLLHVLLHPDEYPLPRLVEARKELRQYAARGSDLPCAPVS